MNTICCPTCRGKGTVLEVSPLVAAGNICHECGVTLAEVCGRGKHPKVSLARSRIATTLRDEFKMKFEDIDRLMGGHGKRATYSTAYYREKQRVARQEKLTA